MFCSVAVFSVFISLITMIAVVSGSVDYCQCINITVQDKNDNAFNKEFYWHYHGEDGSVYKTENDNEYLARDVSGYWRIGSEIDGSRVEFYNTYNSPCPRSGEQPWLEETNNIDHTGSTFIFIVECNVGGWLCLVMCYELLMLNIMSYMSFLYIVVIYYMSCLCL